MHCLVFVFGDRFFCFVYFCIFVYISVHVFNAMIADSEVMVDLNDTISS